MKKAGTAKNSVYGPKSQVCKGALHAGGFFTSPAAGAELVRKHARVPVCRTFHGCIEHVAQLTLKQRWALAFVLRCEPEQLPRQLYHFVQRREA